MGQYKQWLYYRELDQQLHAQVAQLTEELTILKGHVQPLMEERSLSDNTIMHALLAQLMPASSAAQRILPQEKADGSIPAQTYNTASETIGNTGAEDSGIGVSPALHGWTSLPNFDSQQLPVQLPPTYSTTKPELAPATITHPELDLLPKDMATFVDEHTQTTPLRTPPKWLRSILANTPEQEGSSAIYQQNDRTNQLVERWLERWGRSEEKLQREDQE